MNEKRPHPVHGLSQPHVSPRAGRTDAGANEPRLGFMDGLRGLTALYVVLHHAVMELALEPIDPVAARFLGFFLWYGHYAVAVFIVTSGYCLMRPVVHSGAWTLREGFPAYILRRSRRLLPPYYAALALCLLMTAITPGMRRPTGVRWDAALPASRAGVIVSHLFLVHNFRPEWVHKIDPPMWSLATEWQIYLLFPLLLVARRRLGMAGAVVVAFGLGYAAYLMVSYPTFLSICPWFLGLFALGMAAATAAADESTVRTRACRVSWWLATVASAALFFCGDSYLGLNALWLDPVVGVTSACLLVGCSRAKAGHPSTAHTRPLRLLESPRLVQLGVISYSLYLTHFPLLSLAHLGLRSLSLGPTARLVVLMTAAAPLCVLFAFLFHLAFERPFLRRPAAGPRDRRITSRAGVAATPTAEHLPL